MLFRSTLFISTSYYVLRETKIDLILRVLPDHMLEDIGCYCNKSARYFQSVDPLLSQYMSATKR